MKMDRAKKQAFVEELAGKLAGAECVYLTDFTGLDVERITELRSKLRASAVDYVVVKNTLARRAIAGTAAAQLEELLEGPTAFALSRKDAVGAAKVLTDFSKDSGSPRIKGGVIAGRIVSLGEIKRLAALPPREVLLAKLLGSMKSPVSGFTFVLAGVLSKFVRTVEAVRARKAESGETPPEAAPASAPPAVAPAEPVSPGGPGAAASAEPAATPQASAGEETASASEPAEPTSGSAEAVSEPAEPT